MMFDYSLTEKTSMIDKFFESKNHLKLLVIPKKLKHKYLCLLWIRDLFKPNKIYSEIEVNHVLMDVYEDYVLIRRMLIDYNLLERAKDGSAYWVKKDEKVKT